jgi:1-hydroxycarotenoid 3,4-desaturase
MLHQPNRSPSRRRGDLPIICIGGGIGGLSAALQVALQGREVWLLEAKERLGGKAGQQIVGGKTFDTGPTVLTLPWVFEALFAAAGANFAELLRPQPLEILAQHFYSDGSSVALHREAAASRQAIGDFAGAAAARNFDAFQRYAKAIYETTLQPFIESPKPTPTSIWRDYGLRSFAMLRQLDAHRSLWRAVCSFFSDPRLQQLYGRYATYSGGSPFRTPATFNLVAHVEQSGVWRLPGGMHSLAQAMGRLLQQHGGSIRLQARVQHVQPNSDGTFAVTLHDGEQLLAGSVVVNGGPEALAPLLGKIPPRRPGTALSAMTWSMLGRMQRLGNRGGALAYHTVCFGDAYRDEFAAIFGRREITAAPTVYLCAADRLDAAAQNAHPAATGSERLFCLINAPSCGPAAAQGGVEPEPCLKKLRLVLRRCGWDLQPTSQQVTQTPQDFAQAYPGSHGAIYGAPPHSLRSCFSRAGSRSRIAGLYFCGGSVHPGPGVPMAALSGRWAAQALAADYRSTSLLFPAATPGGTSTPRATVASTR